MNPESSEHPRPLVDRLADAKPKLPWPPELIDRPQEMRETVTEAHEWTNQVVLTTDGISTEAVTAAFEEESYAGREAMMRHDSETMAAAQTDAHQLKQFLDGDESQREFVEQYLSDRRDTLNYGLDRLEEAGFTRRTVAELSALDVTADQDQEDINHAELKWKKLAGLRHAAVIGPEATSTPEASERSLPDFPPVPDGSQGKLYKYEREHLTGEYAPERVEQFKAFIDAQIRVHQAKLEGQRATNPDAAFRDQINIVLGNRGKAVEFLAGAARAAGERIADPDAFLRRSFAEAVKAYLDYDLLAEHPDYDQDFRRLDARR